MSVPNEQIEHLLRGGVRIATPLVNSTTAFTVTLSGCNFSGILGNRIQEVMLGVQTLTCTGVNISNVEAVGNFTFGYFAQFAGSAACTLQIHVCNVSGVVANSVVGTPIIFLLDAKLQQQLLTIS